MASTIQDCRLAHFGHHDQLHRSREHFRGGAGHHAYDWLGQSSVRSCLLGFFDRVRAFAISWGVLADRWSPRKVLAFSCVGFSLFTALTPLGQQAFFLLLALRFLVGACESASLPSLTSLNARWTPRHEFSRAQTIGISALRLDR